MILACTAYEPVTSTLFRSGFISSDEQLRSVFTSHITQHVVQGKETQPGLSQVQE